MVLLDFSCQQNMGVKFLSAMKNQTKNQSSLTLKSGGCGPIMGHVMVQGQN